MRIANLINTGNLDFWTANSQKMRIMSNGNVGIGTTAPGDKLHVVGDQMRLADPSNAARYIQLRTDGAGMDLSSYGGSLYLNASNDNVIVNNGSLFRAWGGARISGNTDGSAWAFGVNGQSIFRGWLSVANTTSAQNAISGVKEHTGNSDTYGVFGQNTVSPNYGYGVRGQGGWYGVYGIASSNGGGNRYGVYGRGTGGTGVNYGVYGSGGTGGSSNYAGYFSGNVNVTGTFTNPSDRSLKTEIETSTSLLEKVNQLEVKTYRHKAEHIAEMNLSNKEQIGFIAQELQTVFPDLVSQNKHAIEGTKDEYIDYLGVNYIGLIPVLTKGIQELSAENQDLKDRLSRLEALVANMDK